MLKTLIAYFAPRLLTWLEGVLDPELAQKWAALKARTAELDKAHAELDRKEADLRIRQARSEVVQSELQRKLAAADVAIAADAEKLLELQAKHREIDDAVKQGKAQIDDRTDDDAIFAGVPKSGLRPGSESS